VNDKHIEFTDPDLSWVKTAQLAARLGAWESVLHLYFASFVRYGTRGTHLFKSQQYHEWRSVHKELRQQIKREEQERWDTEREHTFKLG